MEGPTALNEKLQKAADYIRFLSVDITTHAKSGHPTSCSSMAELLSVLFFNELMQDPKNPKSLSSDRFILSKGHAAPALYSAWCLAGKFSQEYLKKNFRTINSDLEGHPTPRLDFIDVATGSLGLGLSAGVGMALGQKIANLSTRTFVLLGDGECAEGSVWEAAFVASWLKLGNLVAIVDVNRIGQSEATNFGWDLEQYSTRFESCGFECFVLENGHSVDEILSVFQAIKDSEKKDLPKAIIAKTVKGYDLGEKIANSLSYHGKPLQPDEFKNRYESQNLQISRDLKMPMPNESGQSTFEFQYTKEIKSSKNLKMFLKNCLEANPRLILLNCYKELHNELVNFKNCINLYHSHQTACNLALGLSCRDEYEAILMIKECDLYKIIDVLRMAAISKAHFKIIVIQESESLNNQLKLLSDLHINIFSPQMLGPLISTRSERIQLFFVDQDHAFDFEMEKVGKDCTVSKDKVAHILSPNNLLASKLSNMTNVEQIFVDEYSKENVLSKLNLAKNCVQICISKELSYLVDFEHFKSSKMSFI